MIVHMNMLSYILSLVNIFFLEIDFVYTVFKFLVYNKVYKIIFRECKMNNKNTISKNSLILFITAISAAVVSAILRCVDLFLFFDPNIGYYTSGAILPTVSDVLLLCFTLFFVIFSFTLLKGASENTPEPSRLPLRLGLGIAVIILLIAFLTFSYFDQLVQMNAPDKILFGLACVSSMIFMANELKATVGTKRNSTYGLFAALTVLFGATSSIPSIIAYHAGVLMIPVPVVTDPKLYLILNIVKYYFILAVTIYTAIRLFANASSSASETTDTPSDSEEMTQSDDNAE